MPFQFPDSSKGVSSIPLPAVIPAPGTAPASGIRGSETVVLSSRMLGSIGSLIPNLEFGYNYTNAGGLRQSLWTGDYRLPLSIGSSSTIFGEAHAEYLNLTSTVGVPFLSNFWSQSPPGGTNRLDLSIGAGYRKLLSDDLLVGVNAFYDSTRLFGSWRSAGSVGLEMAANGPGDSATDLNFNYYSDAYANWNSRGSVFPTFNIIDGIRTGRGNFDVQAGYSHSLFDRAIDLRLSVTGYQLDFGDELKRGWLSGAEFTTGDGLIKLTLQQGWDQLVGSYTTIGAFLNVGFQPGNLLTGDSPFTMPEPVFRSPRNMKRHLIGPVHRMWYKPYAIVANTRCRGLPSDSFFRVGYGKSCFYTGFPQASDQCHTVGRYIISDTEGGRWVNTYDQDWLRFSPYNYDRDIKPMDICQSAAFARAAEGDVVIFVRCGRDPQHNPDSVLWTTELPTLLSNPNVSSIKAYDNCSCPGGGWCHEVVYK